MKISIITVSFNASKTIEETILSVLSQNFSSIEYIIVDGASTDGTLDIIQRHRKKITSFVSEKDKGIYDAMNKGISMCTGDVIGILNADDVYANTDTVSRVAEEFLSSETDAVYGDLTYVAKDNLEKVIRYWRSNEYEEGDFKKGWMPPHPSFFLKRSCYDSFGKFNVTFRISADYELMLRMIYKHGISTKYIPKVITKMRMGGESNVSIKNRILANKEDRRAWKANGLKPGAYTFINKPLRKISQLWRRG